MKVWLCPVKPRNWCIIKDKRVFGVPRQAHKKISEVNPGDILAFYLLKPGGGIVALCNVTSEVFESHSDVWGSDQYPLRVKLEFLPDFSMLERDPIPLALLFGDTDNTSEVVVEPYLRNVWLAGISKEQYKKLKNLFRSRSQGF